MLYFYTILLLMVSSLVMVTSTPAVLMILLIGQTVLSCLLMGVMGVSLWYPYILVLVFVGSMMVVFLYITSLAPKEMFETTSIFYTILVSSIWLLLIMFCNYYSYEGFYEVKAKFLFNSEEEEILGLFLGSSFFIYMYCILNLLYALICVANLSKTSMGPLRMLKK